MLELSELSSLQIHPDMSLYNGNMDEKIVEVPQVGVRQSIPMSAIEQLSRQIVEQFKPIKIILFGSYAYGHPQPESDVDLLVIMETNQSMVQQAIQILRAVQINFGVDLLVYTPQRLAERLLWGDTFLKDVTTKGKVLYESPDR